MHKLFFITVLCLMPISKKHPFPHQKRQMMFFIPLCRRNCCERWYDREASLSSRMQIRIIFFAALIVDPFVFFPRKRSVFKKQPEDDRWEFFFIVKFFFHSHSLNGRKGEYFFVLVLHLPESECQRFFFIVSISRM